MQGTINVPMQTARVSSLQGAALGLGGVGGAQLDAGGITYMCAYMHMASNKESRSSNCLQLSLWCGRHSDVGGEGAGGGQTEATAHNEPPQ